MRIIETEAYTFNELSTEAQAIAINKYREYNQQNVDYLHFFVDDCKEQIEEAGFTDITVQYSLNYCQGDGLSFSADSYSKLGDLINKHLGEGKEDSACIIENNLEFTLSGNKGNYCYSKKDQLDLYLDYYSSLNDIPNTEELVVKVREELEDIYIDLCGKLKKQGYEDIEYQDSEEAIKETINANEYEFTKEGIQL